MSQLIFNYTILKISDNSKNTIIFIFFPLPQVKGYIQIYHSVQRLDSGSDQSKL